MADVPFPPHSGSRAIVLDGTKASSGLSILKVVENSARRHEDQYSRAATGQHKIANQVEMTSARVDNYLVVMML